MDAGASRTTVASDAPRGNRRRSGRLEPPHARAAVPLLLALVLVGLAGALLRAELAAVGNLNLPGPVFIPPPDPAPLVATPQNRVLAVLIDGLRADTAMKMPFLRTLARGTHVDVWADTPTYSAAQYVAALSGVRPADSGVRANVGLLRTPLDSVPRRVRAQGRVAAQLGDDIDWWMRLFGDDWTTAEVFEPPNPVHLLDAARGRMAGADLVWVHLTYVDEVGHTLGAAAPEYELAARAADAELRALALAWGWPQRTVVALADHGHAWPQGGHGGDESDVRKSFLVGSGPGITAGTRVYGARIVDVAPTLAALLGAPSPAQAEGRTLVEILDTQAAAKSALINADVIRHARVAGAVAAARRGLEAAERDARVVRGVAVLICAGLALIVFRRASGRARLGLVAGFASFVVTGAIYFVVFERFSFSADRDASHLAMRSIAYGLVACLFTFLTPIVAVLLRRLTVRDACAFSFLAVVAASPAAVVMFVLCGAFSWRLTCEPAWLAVGPLLSYGMLIPVALFAGVLSGVAGLLELVRSWRAAALLEAHRARRVATVTPPAPAAARP